MPGNTTNIERALGIVVGKLEGIENRLERQDHSRQILHERLDQLVIRITHVESDLSGVKRQTDDMQSVTDDVKAMRQQAQGAGSMGRWLLKIGGWLLSAAAGAASAYYTLTGRPPP